MNVTDRIGVCVQFDDGYSSAYTQAYAYMKTKNVRGTLFMITDKIDSAGYVTTTQTQEMYADEWDVASHGKTGIPLTGMTQAQQEAELGGAITALDTLGFTRSSRHHAYSGGTFDGNTPAAMAAVGMLTGRTVVTDTDSIYPITNAYEIGKRIVLGNLTTLASAKAAVDTAYSQGATIIIYGHKLAATAEDGNTWAIADFQALIDYILTLPIFFLTVSELYTLNTATVMHKHLI